MATKELDLDRAILFKRLSNISKIGYISALKKRWKELRGLNIISFANFEEHINQNHKIIKEAVDDNFIKWPVNNKWYFDDNNYKQEVDLMLQFVERRVIELDKYIADF